MPRPAPDDPLEALRDGVRAVHATAARLADARAPADGGALAGDATAEAQALVALVQALRGMVPEELWEQLTDVVRQVLLLVRAVLDWWVDRLERADRGAPVVQRIPLD